MTVYEIDFTDPLKQGFTIAPGAFNGPGGALSSTTLRLYGRSSLEWGEAVDENFVRLTESFAGATAPLSPVSGQLWVQQYPYWRNEDVALPAPSIGNQAPAPAGAFYLFDFESGDWDTDPTFPVVVINDPSPFPAIIGTTGQHVYNNANDTLYMWDTPYKQAAAQWMPRLYVVASTAEPFGGDIIPVNGVTTPTQVAVVYDEFTEEWKGVTSISGDLDFNGFSAINLAPQTYPLADSDTAATIEYVNTGIAEAITGGSIELLLDPRYVNVTGDAMTGPLSMGGNNITSLPVQTYPLGSSQTAASIAYVNSAIASIGGGGGGGSDTAVGGVVFFAMAIPPSGWLEANGAAVSRATYDDLFALIGTTYGVGDGSTTFNLPDLRGEFIRGYDNGRGIDLGRTFGSFQLDDFKSHTHTGSSSAAGAHTHTVPINTVFSGSDGGTIQGGSGGANSSVATSSSGSHSHTMSLNNTGGTESRPRNIAMMPCIKAVASVGSDVTSFNARTGAIILETADLVDTGGFDNSLTTNGYQVMPGGMIMQWGTTTGTNVVFPIPFPTALLHLELKLNNFNSASAFAGHYQAYTTSNASGFTAAAAASTLSAELKWLAIGH